MLKESLDLHEQKKARSMVSKQSVQEARAEVAQKVALAFMEDRRAKMEADEREKVIRAARARKAAQPKEPDSVNEGEGEEDEEEPRSRTPGMPGPGHILASAVDGPPPYDDAQ